MICRSRTYETNRPEVKIEEFFLEFWKFHPTTYDQEVLQQARQLYPSQYLDVFSTVISPPNCA